MATAFGAVNSVKAMETFAPTFMSQPTLSSNAIRMPSTSTPVTVRTMGMAMPMQMGSYAAPLGGQPTQLGQVVESGRVEVVSGPIGSGPISSPSLGIGGTADLRQLTMALADERMQRQQLQAQMNVVIAELTACKARLDKLDPPETPLRAAVGLVEQRGNLRVNHSTGHVQILRPLAFHPRTTKDEPTASFRDVNLADKICKDLAEISNIFGAPMTIEGHTKGGESDFWQTLANRRANIVADKMVEFGANPNLLETRGLPGRLGKNEVRTEVYMDIRNIKDETAAVTVVDIVDGRGRVVERDMIQAGRVVERDTLKQQVVAERDVMIGGRVVERDLVMGVTGVERDFIGTNGRAVERQMASVYRPAISPAQMVRSPLM